MGKNRKQQQPQPSVHLPPTRAARDAKASPVKSAAQSQRIARRILWQCVAIAALSGVLGLAFNTANPIGVRFGKPSPALAAVTTPTNFNLALTSSVVVVKPTTPATVNRAPEPPASDTSGAKPSTVASAPPMLPPIPRPVLPPPPTATPHLHTPPSPATAPPQSPYMSVMPMPNHTPGAVASTTTPAPATANLNPGPIHWREAKPLVTAGQAVLVDVRARPAYDAGHIPGAFSLPESSSPEEFAAFVQQHPTKMTLIVYCSSTSCSQSQRMAARLVQTYGYPSVKFMTGGYLEYQQEELVNRQSAVQQ
jgi:rhodanese-related sulfurtransferase